MIQKLILILFLILAGILSAQEFTNNENLKKLQEKYHQRFLKQRAIAEKWAAENGIPMRQVLEDGTVIELQRIENGIPLYLQTDNATAAQTISTDEVWTGGAAGLNLDGTGIVLAEWDGGSVLSTHQELTGRVTQEDTPSGTSEHSTHVAGTMMATGVDPLAQGMAEAATLRAWDYNNDTSEMAGAAASLIVSNHSYGFTTGYYNFGLSWAGDTNIDPNEDWKFGYYTADTQEHDQIAYDAPYYLICKSSGNDRGDLPFAGPSPPQDGDVDGGYDTCGPVKVAKNILTVGAIEDIPNGWTQTSDAVMSSFSSWRPADDGRIKPDVVGNGVSLYSSSDAGNTNYATLSGTSMATPNVTGSLGLLAQHYQNLSSGSNMRAATLKALVIHTADEAGNTGPDYQFGWGVVNIQSAAALLSSVFVNQNTHSVQERTLNDGNSYSFQVTSDGSQALRVTIVWTDVPGTPVSPVTQVDPPDLMLINDLDLRVTGNSTTYTPWILDPANPANPATTGDNFRDNVEQVYIASPVAGTYTITVNHKNTLTNGSQAFSLILSGANYSDNSLPVQLSSFNVALVNNSVKLNWVT